MRSGAVILVCGLALGAAGGLEGSAWGLDPTFRDTPILVTRSPEVFRGVFGGAYQTGKTALIIGDSQETCPGGRGDIYIPRLNYEFWARYRASPATPWSTTYTSYGGGQPWGHWLLRAAYAPPGMTETRVAAARLPPGFPAGKTSTRGGVNVNNNQQWGQLYMLQPDCASVNPEAGLAGGNYFDTSQGVWVEVMAATNASSGEVSVRVENAGDSTPSFYAPLTAVMSRPMGLEDPVDGVRQQRLGPFPVPPGRYLQAEIAGTDATKLTDVVAVRFVSVATPRGLTVSSVAAGGYRSDTYLRNHADSGPVMAAFGADVVFIGFGANDITNFHSASRYKGYMVDLIAWVRENLGATVPIVLLSDPPRAGLSQPQRDAYDRYPAMNREIADEDPYVCALNSRRLLDEAGWTYDHMDAYVSDGVHYTALGATLKARLEAQALFGAFSRTLLEMSALDAGGALEGPSLGLDVVLGQPAAGVLSGPSLRWESGFHQQPDGALCRADFNQDGFLDFFDYDGFVECFEGVGCPTPSSSDINGDGFTDFFDYDLFVTLFEQGC